MQQIHNLDQLAQLQAQQPVLILFGGPTCSVCKSLQLKLDELMPKQFPSILSVYVDCQTSPELAAQYGVFSLPVIKVYIDNKLVIDQAGVFSLQQLLQQLERTYEIWQSSKQELRINT